jgi:hypothetical protein
MQSVPLVHLHDVGVPGAVYRDLVPEIVTRAICVCRLFCESDGVRGLARPGCSLIRYLLSNAPSLLAQLTASVDGSSCTTGTAPFVLVEMSTVAPKVTCVQKKPDRRIVGRNMRCG